MKQVEIKMSNMKTYSLLQCSQCSKFFSYDPGNPVYCPNHPQAELALRSDFYSRVKFFEGCGVVGICLPFGPPGMEGVSTDTYCKLYYDTSKKYWKWEAELPQKRRKNVITEIDLDEKIKYSGLVHRIVHWFGHYDAIWYSPGYPVGVTIFQPNEAFVSCPFNVAEHVQVSFQPDGKVDLKPTASLAGPDEYKEELYKQIIGEVFSIMYDENRGWVWVQKEIEALERHEEEQKKKQERWREEARKNRENKLREKKEKEESALEE
jgi:hypothetical protein